MGKKTPEQIIIDSFFGSRLQNPTFKKWPDDTFIGYATGITIIDNLGVNMNADKWEKLIRKMLKEGKI